MNVRQIRSQLSQGLTMAMVLSSAYIFWKLLSIVTNSGSPLVVVLSGSMEPAFQRGDILFLWNRDQYVDTGDIVVYNIQDRSIPIVHRVVREHIVYEVERPTKEERKKGTKKGKTVKKQLLLTKGDNNEVNDLSLYAYGQKYLDRDRDIVGSVKGYLPKIGYVTILVTENQYFKYAMLGWLVLSVLLTNE
ncbi:unnamed protein product [Ambrosiozyma monospora]|uniref:Signal peptidase complex catalytic subunit SEC11 n=1 Tax=Ambrosiozyma monospora TaxID=43982 RepID=A0A9W6Z6R9_AMBMO|nr:unnamed protein product [Ambrosiozyma monospora]